MARKDAVGNTRGDDFHSVPDAPPLRLGWQAPVIRRTVIVGAIGLIVAVVLPWFMPWRWPWWVAGTWPRSPSSWASGQSSSAPTAPRRAAGKTHLPVPKLLAVPRAPTSVPVAEPGVMMGLEINTLAMQGLSWRRPQMPLRGDAAPEGRWAPGLAR
jgi:hypothetical protein